jgi:hypothetical protein
MEKAGRARPIALEARGPRRVAVTKRRLRLGNHQRKVTAGASDDGRKGPKNTRFSYRGGGSFFRRQHVRGRRSPLGRLFHS